MLKKILIVILITYSFNNIFSETVVIANNQKKNVKEIILEDFTISEPKKYLKINEVVEIKILSYKPATVINSDFNIILDGNSIEYEYSSEEKKLRIKALAEGVSDLKIVSEDNNRVSKVVSFIVDNTPPVLNGVIQLNTNKIYSYFSEIVDSNDLLNISNYRVSRILKDNSENLIISNIVDVTGESDQYSQVYIELVEKLKVGYHIKLEVDNIKDLAENEIDLSKAFDDFIVAPQLETKVDIKKLTFNEGKIKLGSDAVTFSDDKNVDPATYTVYITKTGDIVSPSTIVGIQLVNEDGSSDYFADQSFKESIILETGVYDIHIAAKYHPNGKYGEDSSFFPVWGNKVRFTME